MDANRRGVRDGRRPPLISKLQQLPLAAQAYVGGVVLAGAGLYAWRLGTRPLHAELSFLILLLLSAALGSRTVSLGQKAEMALSLPLILGALMLTGVYGAVDVAVVGMLSTCLIRRHPFPPHRTLFNVASIVLATFCSGAAYVGLRAGDVSLAPSAYFLPLLAAVAVYFAGNTCVVAMAIALSSRRPFAEVWIGSFRWTFVSYLAAGSIAAGMVRLLESFGPYSLVLAVPPILLLYYFYRLYADRAAERQKRIEEIERHNAELGSEVARRTQELVEVNARLSESNEELKRANRLKSEFLANMSHELRTPLNAIIGFSELLEDDTFGTLTEDQVAFVKDIHAGGRHLLELINDILDLSKIEAGRMTLTREDCDLPALIKETLTVIRPLALKKQLRMSTSIDTEAGFVFVDSGKIKQVMYNLLSNAVKFTEDGGSIEVSARALDRELVVSVTDTGIGIPAADLARIFEEFYQVDGSLTRKHEGTGLGLALVKRLVEMHGGRVEVESVPGQGSTFRFAIPGAILAPMDAPAGGAEFDDLPARESGAAATHRSLVMIVEDNPTNMRLTRNILASQGFGVLEAPSGEEALRLMKLQKPDLILMDLQLPGVDGLTLTRMIHNDPLTCGIPTIALTACAMAGDEQRAREAGCVGYISKPVSAANLSRQVAATLSSKAL